MNFLLASTVGEWMDKTFLGFDLGIFSFFGRIGNDFLDAVAKIFTTLGDTKYVVMIGVLALVLVFFRKTRKVGLAVLISIVLGTLITNVIVKPVFLRIRPYNTLQYLPEYFGWYTNAGMLSESDYCFPSGHTTAAFEIGVSLCLYFASAGKKKIAWIFPVLAALTGLSRIYLMVHYTTDVLAGVIVGVCAGIVGYNISRVLVNRFSGTAWWQKYDLERLIRKKTGKPVSGRAACTAIAAAWAVIFAVSLVLVFRSGGDNLRCAYSGDYDCYNEVKEKDEYLIDGKYYCKIHARELTEQQN